MTIDEANERIREDKNPLWGCLACPYCAGPLAMIGLTVINTKDPARAAAHFYPENIARAENPCCGYSECPHCGVGLAGISGYNVGGLTDAENEQQGCAIELRCDTCGCEPAYEVLFTPGGTRFFWRTEERRAPTASTADKLGEHLSGEHPHDS